MNESLAKQLHDLCGHYKANLIENTHLQINLMEDEINEIIEKEQKLKNQEAPKNS